MAKSLIGTWNFDSGDNMENYMTAVGVPDKMREMAKTAKPILDISQEGTVWTVKTTVGDKVQETKYPENEEIETISLMGQTMKATLTVDGDGIKEVQNAGDVEVVIQRKVEDGVLVSTLSAKGVEAVLKFVKA